MPEIPELEAFEHLIKTDCLNKKIDNIQSSDKKLIKHNFNDFKKKLISHKFISAERQGKYLIINISSSDYKLIIHFGLTGFLIYSKDEKIKFSRVEFIFNNDHILHWIDIRKFGKIWLIKNLDEIKGLNELGPDPLKLSKQKFIDLAEKYKTKNIKSFLMDQSLIAGIGNEYSDEILFQSGIDPHHKIKELTKTNILKIYSQMLKVLKYSINLRIRDIKKYPEQNFLLKKDKLTFKSSYLQAHRHTDKLCPKNKNHKLTIAHINGRSAYYCKIDQK